MKKVKTSIFLCIAQRQRKIRQFLTPHTPVPPTCVKDAGPAADLPVWKHRSRISTIQLRCAFW